MKNKAWTKSFLSSLIAILCGLIFGLLIMFLVIPNQALEGFSILLRGGFYRGIKSVGEVLYLSVPIMMTGLSVAFASVFASEFPRNRMFTPYYIVQGVKLHNSPQFRTIF